MSQTKMRSKSLSKLSLGDEVTATITVSGCVASSNSNSDVQVVSLSSFKFANPFTTSDADGVETLVQGKVALEKRGEALLLTLSGPKGQRVKTIGLSESERSSIERATPAQLVPSLSEKPDIERMSLANSLVASLTAEQKAKLLSEFRK
ncbi:MAG: hypothetical protein AAFX06_26475 [Planctomycetota bacterium]